MKRPVLFKLFYYPLCAVSYIQNQYNLELMLSLQNFQPKKRPKNIIDFVGSNFFFLCLQINITCFSTKMLRT